MASPKDQTYFTSYCVSSIYCFFESTLVQTLFLSPEVSVQCSMCFVLSSARFLGAHAPNLRKLIEKILSSCSLLTFQWNTCNIHPTCISSSFSRRTVSVQEECVLAKVIVSQPDSLYWSSCSPHSDLRTGPDRSDVFFGSFVLLMMLATVLPTESCDNIFSKQWLPNQIDVNAKYSRVKTLKNVSDMFICTKPCEESEV